MIDTKTTERSLFAAIVPPGPSHVDAVLSLGMATDRETALNAGFWAALPLDYLLRITGRSDLRVTEVNAMPAPQAGHPLESGLLLRTLRLNCLTSAYSNLWSDLYDLAWANEPWAADWVDLAPLGGLAPGWSRLTPLRSERERRAALVEIDALVAVWLGIAVDELIAVLKARYPILTGRESEMWFDARGRRVARDPYAFGLGQAREHYEQLMVYLEDSERNPVPEGYTAPFYKADREAEYRQAHAVFSRRLQDAIDAGWQPS
jgi:hypothetical protein